ncbi:glycoside hydrolase family 2 protein [Amycolatopsis thermoflava]|uniref:Glycosyl hydrolase family 2 n=1 Tax=Amycolatopsis thermoflava TaxID=84480 RepID=A0A3N2GXL4_9PSEU|nr:sugar-binding domain-containing protein [Amycolatopsis thermoflava]ROS41421.1 glycosyl hydrolase family 2 [Amycolatopsis thermoflava]
MIPRAEYPRPQFVRPDWLCLNGNWQFEVDRADSGLERGLTERELTGEIVVPFCPESELSGVEDVDFMEAVWYRRTVLVPADWRGRKVLLHFQAVDHDATVWVNGHEVARHRGGWTPFTADLSDVVAPGKDATIVVRARDPRTGPQARGKQSERYENYTAYYTRTTGIWQTVWLEPVPESHLLRPRITPELATSSFTVEARVSGPKRGLVVRARLSDSSGELASATARVDLDFTTRVELPVPAGRRRLWCPEDPALYDITIELVDGDGRLIDSAQSYAGLRGIAIDDKAVLLNGRPVFQRLVLDQGYYPDGLMTAPSEKALVKDIELAMSAGFNGARLHQKVFEERFLYHCDRLGYLVWGEFGDWGAYTGAAVDCQQPTASFTTQWLEVLERDHSHPSIVGWCPLNETLQTMHDRITVLDDVTRGMFLATKAADRSRPVIDASGYSHRMLETDVYDSHNYEQDPAKFAEAMAGIGMNRPFVNGESDLPLPRHLPDGPWSVPYGGQPYFCSEFGGIWWNSDSEPGEDSWGYGEAPRSLEEFYRRFEGLVSVLLDNMYMFGYCYTQLTDVFQEQNGLFRFDRSAKFDVARIRAAQSAVAAIEKVSPIPDRSDQTAL